MRLATSMKDTILPTTPLLQSRISLRHTTLVTILRTEEYLYPYTGYQYLYVLIDTKHVYMCACTCPSLLQILKTPVSQVPLFGKRYEPRVHGNTKSLCHLLSSMLLSSFCKATQNNMLSFFLVACLDTKETT